MSIASCVYVADVLLGMGGAGRVYGATHLPSGRRVALKTLKTPGDQSNAFGLLMREAAMVAQLHHPNIVELLDAVVHGQRPYLVLELVDGTSARDWLFEWPGWGTVRRALGELFDALSVAHAAGIVHRDIKPSNLLISRDGQLKVTDFGIATLLDPLADASDALRGGTPRYMAPEQLDAEAHHGPWTDLYAVGVILFELLAGASPLAGKNHNWREEKRRPPPPLVPRPELEVTPELSAWIARLLDPNPTGRPRFAAQARRELEELGDAVRERASAKASAITSAILHSLPMTASITSESSITSGSISSSFAEPPTTPLAREWPARSSPESEPVPPSITELPFEVPGPAELSASAALVSLRPPPLVARERERKLLSGIMADAIVSRRPRALVLSGEAGVGKTRLARWALAEVERLGLMEGTAAAFEVSGTTDGLRQLLRRLLGPRPWARWQLDSTALDVARLEAFLAPDDRSTELPLSERVELARDALAHASRVFPLYVWLDDVGWAHDGTRELVESLLGVSNAPIAIVMTVRAGTAEHPELKPWLERLTRHPRAKNHRVDRLESAALEELLSAAAPLSADLRHELARKLDDTPHVVVQLVHSLIASGELAPSAEGFRLPPGRSVDELLARAPRATLLAGRVHKLIAGFETDAAGAERVLLRAGLWGNRFTEAELGESVATGREKQLIPFVIGRGLLHGLLRLEPDLSVRFEHEFVREALLARLAGRADAAELCRDVADATLRLRGAQRWEAQVTAGRLLAQAGDVDRALELHAEAALDLARLAAYRQADEILAEARAYVEASPSDRRLSRLLMAESMVPYFALDVARAVELNRTAQQHAERAGDFATVTRCLADRADFYYYLHEFGASERLAALAVSRCDRSDDASAMALSFAAFRLAELASLRGELERAREHYEIALDCSKRTPFQIESPALLGQDLALAELALIDFELAYGDKARAAQSFERVARLATDPRSGEFRILLLETRIRLAVATGRGHELRAEIQAFLGEREARADAWRVTSLTLLDALAASELADRDSLAAATDRFLAAFAKCSHEKPFTFWALRTLSERLAQRGEHERAVAVSRALEALQAEIARGFARDRGSGLD